MPVVSATVKLNLIFVCLAFLASTSASAFGARAHRIVGFIANERLCEQARLQIVSFIPDADLAAAGLWADYIRSDPDWDFVRPWHYMNVDALVPIGFAERSSKGDVLSAIVFFAEQLEDEALSLSKRTVAFYFVVHFVADIHQPLHVGRAVDLGGNRVDIQAGEYRGNLHNYWDSGVLREVENLREYAADLANEYSSVAEVWALEQPLRWATESQQLRPGVYAFERTEGGVGLLDDRYQTQAAQVVRHRLAQAGVRLAGLLNGIWCGAPDKSGFRGKSK